MVTKEAIEQVRNIIEKRFPDGDPIEELIKLFKSMSEEEQGALLTFAALMIGKKDFILSQISKGKSLEDALRILKESTVLEEIIFIAGGAEMLKKDFIKSKEDAILQFTPRDKCGSA